jgi:hypothetical protein
MNLVFSKKIATIRRSEINNFLHLANESTLQPRLRHNLHRLPHAQIRQNLLGAAQNCVELVTAVEHLDNTTHTTPGDTTTSEDIRGVIGNIMSAARRVRFQQGDGAGEELALLGVGHVVHLVGDLLEPGLGGLGQGDHFGEFGADDGLRDQGFAEDDALVGPLEALFCYEANPADYAAAHHPAFLFGSLVRLLFRDGNEG